MSILLNARSLLLVAALSLSAATFAESTETPEPDQAPARKCKHHPAFGDFDLDGDGTITRDEFNAGHAERFKERAAAGKKMKNAGKLPKMFDKIDTDGDALLSAAEFEAHVAHKCGKAKGKT